MKPTIFTLVACLMSASTVLMSGVALSLPYLDHPKPETVIVGEGCRLSDAFAGLCQADP